MNMGIEPFLRELYLLVHMGWGPGSDCGEHNPARERSVIFNSLAGILAEIKTQNYPSFMCSLKPHWSPIWGLSRNSSFTLLWLAVFCLAPRFPIGSSCLIQVSGVNSWQDKELQCRTERKVPRMDDFHRALDPSYRLGFGTCWSTQRCRKKPAIAPGWRWTVGLPLLNTGTHS